MKTKTKLFIVGVVSIVTGGLLNDLLGLEATGAGLVMSGLLSLIVLATISLPEMLGKDHG